MKTLQEVKKLAIECGARSHLNCEDRTSSSESAFQVVTFTHEQLQAFYQRAYEDGRKMQRESDEQIAMNWPDDCVFDVAEAIRNNTGE